MRARWSDDCFPGHPPASPPPFHRLGLGHNYARDIKHTSTNLREQKHPNTSRTGDEEYFNKATAMMMAHGIAERYRTRTSVRDDLRVHCALRVCALGAVSGPATVGRVGGDAQRK